MRDILNLKFKANSLFYALVILLLSGILLTALIYSTYLFRIEQDLYQTEVELVQNSRSGLKFLSAQESPYFEEWVDLFQEGTDSVKLKKYPWGTFYILSSKASNKGRHHTKSAIAGKQNNNSLAIALRSRSYDPLTLSGRTKIVGDVYLPNGRVERGYIEGQNFVGNRLVQGEIIDSEFNMDENLSHLKGFISGASTEEYEYRNFSNYIEDTLENSFTSTPLILSSTDSISLSSSISGAIAVLSQTAIYVSPDALLEHTLLIAPRVYIGSNFIGKVHVVASEMVEIQERAILEYPSSVSLINEDKELRTEIHLSPQSELRGTAVLLSENKRSSLKIDQAKIVGEVISDSYVELKGSIIGSVVTNHFLLETPSSTYEDHLLNATVDSEQLPSQFVGILGSPNSNSLKIADYVE